MAEEVKFTDDEMTKLKEVQDGYAKIAFDAGQLFLERTNVLSRLEELDSIELQSREKHKELREKERQFTKELTDKYGNGELNPQTGVFTPRP